jgi:hypothetical protein
VLELHFKDLLVGMEMALMARQGLALVVVALVE